MIEVLDKAMPPLDSLKGLLHPYQRRAIQSPARFRWSNWSRQTGKSFAHTLRRILRGMERRKNQILLSTGARQSRELMEKVGQHLQAMRVLAQHAEFDEVFEGVTCRVMEAKLPEFGMKIVALPANPLTTRGYTGDLLFDEFAMHRDSIAIWAAAFPAVTRNLGEVDICSTPRGMQNMFYRLKQNNIFEHDTLTILDAVEQGCPADIEILKAACTDEETWRQEYLCEFVDEATAFLTWEQILACEDEKLPRELDLESLATCAGDVGVGIDIGRKHDLTVIWAFERIGSLLVSRGMIELRALSFREQFEMISSVLKNRCVRRCAIDATGLGMQLAEELVTRFGGHMVEGCPFTPAFKETIANGLRIKFLDKNIRIPADEKLRSDLHSVEKSVTAAGNVRLSAPREGGSHADRFWGGALACYAASDPYVPLEVTFGERFEERSVL